MAGTSGRCLTAAAAAVQRQRDTAARARPPSQAAHHRHFRVHAVLEVGRRGPGPHVRGRSAHGWPLSLCGPSEPPRHLSRRASSSPHTQTRPRTSRRRKSHRCVQLRATPATRIAQPAPCTAPSTTPAEDAIAAAPLRGASAENGVASGVARGAVGGGRRRWGRRTRTPRRGPASSAGHELVSASDGRGRAGGGAKAHAPGGYRRAACLGALCACTPSPAPSPTSSGGQWARGHRNPSDR